MTTPVVLPREAEVSDLTKLLADLEGSEDVPSLDHVEALSEALDRVRSVEPRDEPLVSLIQMAPGDTTVGTTPTRHDDLEPQDVPSITSTPQNGLNPQKRYFPAVLDIGLNHNLSIREEHLDLWTKLKLDPYRWIQGQYHYVRLQLANVWIHYNEPGLDTMLSLRPERLRVPDGIIVYPTTMPNPARIPTLGLRALVRNDLKLIIDGKPREVTLTKPPTEAPP